MCGAPPRTMKMKIMVDADEYEQLKKDVEIIQGMLLKLAVGMGRLDLLVAAGGTLLINGEEYVPSEE